ncbi:NitT/TauT family transport system ATP-binding protein [Ruminococcus sp. YE71]|uniref:ABC transporter ATP-binding protein n=1 Tax=unclassified Ruminococcus TaxID=2608920 RepID=UPI0008851761|nr:MULTISPECIES: ABC transporter ATP-binding protein [unclassified Ruminococcus]SDA24324.1 NitT/TauT family transport system ATP-binding protein [Ruminococcus sp. YE78]SFW41822.1 NitT/TauT family transport system ATP-binding protein [Ruminococcus sp. YE71]
MATIEFKNVDFKYSNNSTENILNNVSFTIKEGEFVSIIGGSGCGKSTTLSLLSGLNHASGGSVTIGGKAVTGPGKDRGVVFQHYALFPWMRAKRNVEFGIRQVLKADKKTISEKAEKYLKLVGLEGSEHLFPHQLSGGMQQRVAIARLLAMEPDILLMDEPFGAIDAKNRVALQELLLNLLDSEDEKKSVVFVTHDIDEAILLSDRILFMRDHEIYRDLKVPFERPRSREEITASDTYHEFRRELFDLFYDNDIPRQDKEPEQQKSPVLNFGFGSPIGAVG